MSDANQNPTPRYKPGSHGYSRVGPCGCCWNPRVHGDYCPEHGLEALQEVEPIAGTPATTPSQFQRLWEEARKMTLVEAALCRSIRGVRLPLVEEE